MSLFLKSWRNFAASLWQKEAVQKLDAYARDTAWAGLHISSNKLINPGGVIAPWDANSPPDYKIVSDLLAGSLTVDPEEGGLYQINVYFTFQVAANGGTYLIEFYQDGISTEAGVAINLSNQSDVGNGAICSFAHLDPGVSPAVFDLRLDIASTRAITMLRADWSLVRLYPNLPAL